MSFIESYIFCQENENWCLCPFCKQIGDSFFLEDYVTIPMFWCKNCSATCVMSKKQFEELNVQVDGLNYINRNIEDVPIETKQKFIGIANFNEGYFAKIKFIKINRILNCELKFYKSEQEANQEELQHFINSNFNKEIGEKYGYSYIDEDEDIDEKFINYDIFKSGASETQSVFNMGLKIDTFNIESPTLVDIPFKFKGQTDNFKTINQNRYLDTRTDGCFIFLECVDFDGSLFYCKYTGD